MQRLLILVLTLAVMACGNTEKLPDDSASNTNTKIRGAQAGSRPAFANETHREFIVCARSHFEAYDNAVEVMSQHFTNFAKDDSATIGVSAMSAWQRIDEMDRLVRRRARVYVWDASETDKTHVKIAVERQFSTNKTAAGQLDRVSPKWSRSTYIGDLDLEKALLLQISRRLQGRVIKS